ncbi:hypothetical protein PMZ80_007496 [Knufia obscura]|uniref:Uncharacterized protein n=1 Tax=Knufia obscura TaxID=1635080 RepID=A0ABR0RHH1_9EURO|nr:hypothetical protein PMZ80_007496 [Knufia obscura]
MAVTKSIMLTVILAAQGLAAGSFGDNKKNIQLGAPVAANVLPRLAHPIQARQVSPSAASTTVQVPIATVCPANGTPESSAPFEPVSLPTVTLSDVTDSIVAASAPMPDGSMTTFASRARRQDAAVGAQLAAAITLPGGIMARPLVGEQPDAGQLVVGSDGCQTLFSPTTTAVCSTVVSPAGLPPVTITDCDQYITFSSETLFTCVQTPTYSPIPYSTASASNGTITLGEDTFTTRPFPTSSTSTIGEDSNDETASTTTEGDATITDLASGEDLEDVNKDMRRRQLLKRQLMFSRSLNAPVLTDLATVTPRSTATPEKRQLMFDRGSNKPVMTDLDTISPASSSMPMPEKRQVMFDHKGNKPATTDLDTIAPTPTPANHIRAPLMASGYTTGLPLHSTNNTADGIFAAATRILSIPAMLRAKYNREHVVLHHREHPRQLDDTTNLPIAPLTPQLNTTMNSTRLNNTLPVHNKLAHLSPPQPTKYFLAPWTEMLGGLPTHIKALTCHGGLPPSGSCTTLDTDGDTESCECDIELQSWSATTLSDTRVGTTVASFSGPVVVTYGGGTSTTNMDFTQTLTTTRVEASVSVVRRTLSPGETFTDVPEATITIVQTSIPSATMTLLPGDGAGNGQGQVKAGMPQDAASSITTSDTPTDASTTPLPEGMGVSILPYTETSEDGYYGSVTGVPGTDLPTTVVETSYVATQTVTVPGDGEGVAAPTDGAGSVPAKGKRGDVWSSVVWLAHLESVKGMGERVG